MSKLSKMQTTTLEKLAQSDWRGAYPGLSLGTLNSLSLRKLVEAKFESGSMAMPHTSIKWRITDAGRAALKTGAN